ncbi:efflux RND transporter periplasmic adaptor subunit [Lentibacter algarum]|uniref:efflux RND transporter periplasmic adaptor subunit n=1 Tax=Lentibacter algarum TaxID=576131 RepID=UPI001C094E60|nr:efflux RND transporter periplasmic adaptor subunit [Lentibacter algarum]MBU2982701.1 efflux RND transporter periplasmic adaptor subunit [Lentibacter algarum]
MRIIPLLTALLVTAFLFLLVIKRESLLGFAGAEAAETEQTGDSSNALATKDTPEKPAVGVIAVHSSAREIDSAVLLRGQTEAAREVVVRAETTGQMISEPLRKGAFVEQGETLCVLDPGSRASNLAEAKARLAEAQARVPETEAQIPRAQAQLEQAKAQLVEARINDNAARKLSKGGFASDTRVAQTEANLRASEAGIKVAEAGVKTAQSGLLGTQAAIQSAEAGVAAAAKEISRLTLRAPFGGILESDTAELGALLQPGAACATVIQLDPVKLVGFVPETQVSRVALGARAGAKLTTGQTLTGNVTFLGRSADPLTRTFRVEVEVPNPDLAVRDGQTTEIIIAAEGSKAHLVPQSALTLNDNGDLGVRLVDADSRALFAPVTLLRDSKEGVWLAGLPEVADVIIIGQEYVIDGVPVAPTFEEPAQ